MIPEPKRHLEVQLPNRLWLLLGDATQHHERRASLNGGLPVAIAYITLPRLKRSER